MISRKQIVWVLAGVLFVAFGAAVGQEGSEPPERPAVESPAPEQPGVESPAPEHGGEGDKPGDGNSEKGAAGQEAKPTGQRDSLFSSWLLPVMIGGLLLMFLLSSRGRKKRDRKRQEMLAALKKGAKVTTIGGIIGTVMEVREDEVTVKVDEQNNVRMRFSRRAIQGVGNEARKEVGDQNK